MSLLNYTRQRYYALENVDSGSDLLGKAIFSPDFKTIIVDLEQDALDGDLVVYVSDQYDEPDVSQPEGPNNDYHAVGYTDTESGVFFAVGFPYNPSSSTPGGNRRFNVESTGARWVIPCIFNRTTGTVQKLSVALYDNQ